MPSIDERYQRSLAALRGLPLGAAAWLWLAVPGAGGLPFFVLTPQDADPTGARLSRRAQWVAAQEAPVFTARGVVRRLQSGLLTLSTDAALEPLRVAHAGLCARAPMPDLLVLRLAQGRVAAAGLLQDLRPLAEAVDAMGAGETRWFSLADTDRPDRLRVTTERGTRDAQAAAVRGQLRRSAGGDFLLRVDAAQARRLGLGLQQWGQQAAPWPALQALSCARIVTRTRKEA